MVISQRLCPERVVAPGMPHGSPQTSLTQTYTLTRFVHWSRLLADILARQRYRERV